MAYPIRVRAEAIREMAFGDVEAAYTAVGVATTNIGRLVRFCNDTDVTIYFSLDGVTDHYRLPPRSFMILDISTNQTTKDNFFIYEGQVFYVRHAINVSRSFIH